MQEKPNNRDKELVMKNENIQFVLMVIGSICSLGGLFASAITNNPNFFLYGYPAGAIILLIMRRRA